MKQRLIDGDEFDWVAKATRKLINWRSGEGKYIKRKMNKRNRQESKLELDEVIYEGYEDYDYE